MKKILLTIGFCFALFFTYAQCVVSFTGNNGGGNCDPLSNGDVATGTITICFDQPVTEATAPDITCVFDLTNLEPITGLTFVLLKIDNQGCAVYCYYEGPNNNNNLFGANTSYSFCTNDPVSGQPTCGVEEAPLPVNFRSFTAVRNRSNVGLTWITAQEQNNAGFEIQRLIGNSGWQSVAFIATQAQGGNSISELTYTYNDLNNTKGITQYRLRQIDEDSRSKLSYIRAVRGEGQNVRPIIYPNPASGGRVNVALKDINGSFDVSLVDLNGRIVKEWRRLTNNSIQIENLTPGIYNLRILTRETGEQTVEKIVVVKN